MAEFTFLYTTRYGSYYHLTPFHYDQLNLKTPLISVGDFVHMSGILEKLKKEKKTFKEYLGFKEDCLVYLTAIDSYKNKVAEGAHNMMAIKLQQNNGMQPFTIEQYQKLIQLINPDWIVSLTEPPSSGDKSLNRSIMKTHHFLQILLEQNKNSQVFAAIQGNLDLEYRSEAVKQVIELTFPDHKYPSSKYPNFGGFVFYGFNDNDDIQLKDQSLEAALSEIPKEIITETNLILAGLGEILSLIWGACRGIRTFEIEYPFKLAEKFTAIILPKIHFEDLDQFQNDEIDYNELIVSQIDQLSFPLSESNEHVPIDFTCDCFTCKNHTKMYITHLVNCQEMNANVLLSIHNTYQYQRLLKVLNEKLKEGKLNQWIRAFLNELK